MSIATIIKDNTDDGRNIVRFLIDVMDDNIDDATLSHRLTAARLLTVYGQADAPDFIEDNTPEKDDTNNGRKIWLEIDEGLRNPHQGQDRRRARHLHVPDRRNGGQVRRRPRRTPGISSKRTPQPRLRQESHQVSAS